MNQAYFLKLASKHLQRIVLICLSLLPFSFVVDFVLNGFSLPDTLSAFSEAILLTSLLVIIGILTFFLFYRQKAKVYMDEKGIQLPAYELISWRSIQWYRIDRFSNNSGLRQITIKYGDKKAVMLAEDSEVLCVLEVAIKEQLRVKNPQAKDFRELKSSKITAYILIAFFISLHLTIIFFLGFQKKYVWIFTLVLFITIGAILIEHIKKLDKQS